MNDWQEVRVVIHREAHEAMTEILLNEGAQGVAIEDDLLIREAKEMKWGDYVPEVNITDYVTIKAYFFEHKSKKQLAEIAEKGRHLSNYGLEVGKLDISSQLLREEDWAHAWKAYYHPTVIGNVVVQPTWEEYQPQPGQLVIKLDPGMAFGTGTHETTAMCIEALQKVTVRDKVVWDIGTGSGILSIVAAKLGAKQVFAVDTDSVAIEVSKENALLNQVDFTAQRGTMDVLQGQPDLIIANIIADVIIDLIPGVASTLLAGGLFLASGIISDRAEQVKNIALKYNLELQHENRQGEWVFYSFRRKEIVG